MQLPTQLPTRLPTRLNTIEDYYLATGGGGRLQPETRQAIARVQADGGVVEQPQLVNGLISTIKNAGVYSLWAGGWARGFGEKFRVSGPDRFVSKAYDLSPQQADLAQTIEGEQPIALTDTEWQFATGRNIRLASYDGVKDADGYTIIQVAVDPLTQIAPAFSVDILDVANFNANQRILGAGKVQNTGTPSFHNRATFRRITSDSLQRVDGDVTAKIRAYRANFRTGNTLAEFIREKTTLASSTAVTAGKTANTTGSIIVGVGASSGQQWDTTQRMTLIFRDAITGAAYDAIIDYLKQLYPDYITP
jgi:hypothetical protein